MTINHIPGIVSCSSKIKKLKKISTLAKKKEQYFLKTPRGFLTYNFWQNLFKHHYFEIYILMFLLTLVSWHCLDVPVIAVSYYVNLFLGS